MSWESILWESTKHHLLFLTNTREEGGFWNSQVEVDRESMRQILSLFALKYDTYDSQLRRSQPDPLQEGSNTIRSLPQGQLVPCPSSSFLSTKREVAVETVHHVYVVVIELLPEE